MRGTLFKGVVLGALTSTLVLTAASALAGTGIGGVFNLGRTNTVNATSSLTGAKAGKMLQVTNTSTGAGATALGLNVAAGKTPFTVNSGTKVANLNADKVDGKEAADLVGARAAGVIWAASCNPFCQIIHGKGVAYAVEVSEGRFCVGVNGVSAQDHGSVAVVTTSYGREVARWIGAIPGNIDFVGSEFEVLTALVPSDGSSQIPASLDFTIVVA